LQDQQQASEIRKIRVRAKKKYSGEICAAGVDVYISAFISPEMLVETGAEAYVPGPKD